MSFAVASRTIQAPIEQVFDAVAHADRFAQIVEDIVRVDYVSEQKRGVGTRFRETRRMNGKEATMELEVAEYIENQRVRLVADDHGTVWDTLFTLERSGEGTVLTMTMDARPHKLLAKLFNPLIRGMVRKGVERDMDAVKASCER